MTERGVVSLWRDAWAADPGQIVLIDQATGRTWTAAELEAASAAGAVALAEEGIGAGDAVVLSSAPADSTAIAFVALLRLGAVVVPVNTAATPREIAHVLAVSGARLAVTDEPERFEGLVPALSVHPFAIPETPTLHLRLDQAQPGDRALICFTSGTTGAPKGAPLTHANLAAGTRALVECWEWVPDDVLVSALPMFHVHGLLVALAGTLTAGARLVVHHRFDPRAIADSVREHEASLVFGVPTMWARFAEAGVLPEFRGLRLAISGSAPLSPALFDVVAEGIGQAPVERYGMTETLIITSTPVDGERKAGTVGRPLPGMEVRLGDDGVVEVRGGSVFGGYLIDAPDAPLYRAGFTDDGWFRTGDVGEWDGPDLRLVGRASELIITGGYNVYPREVEDVLRADRAVGDVAVVGIPHPTWGETVAAFIELAPGEFGDEAAVARWESLCEEELAPYKRPRGWHLVDTLPRNAMGKVKRDDLRARGSS